MYISILKNNIIKFACLINIIIDRDITNTSKLSNVHYLLFHNYMFRYVCHFLNLETQLINTYTAATTTIKARTHEKNSFYSISIHFFLSYFFAFLYRLSFLRNTIENVIGCRL